MIHSNSKSILTLQARWEAALAEQYALAMEAETILEAWDCRKASLRRQRLEARSEAAGRKARALLDKIIEAKRV